MLLDHLNFPEPRMAGCEIAFDLEVVHNHRCEIMHDASRRCSRVHAGVEAGIVED